MALINGTASDDTLTGTAANDVVYGFAGNDTLNGGGGDDRLFGDLPGSTVSGNDVLIGGAGSDLIVGGPGFDVALFDLPRRAYTGQLTTLDFSQFEPAAGSGGPQILPGIILGTGSASASEVDLLIEVEELRFPDGRVVFNQADPIAQVYRVYETGLGRAPDPIALNASAAQVAAGQPASAVANALAQSPEFQAKYGALGNAAFVEQLYENAFGRTGDADGASVWTNALNTGATTRGALVAAFASSQEAIDHFAPIFQAGVWAQDAHAAQVARLYDTAFDRLPDFPGFQTAKAALDSGTSLAQLAQSFEQSPEFAALYGGPNVAPAALVNALYTNTLGRPADAAGLSFWTQQISSGAATREQVIVAFSESQEHQALLLPYIEGGIVFA